jgi:hypothetical protein
MRGDKKALFFSKETLHTREMVDVKVRIIRNRRRVSNGVVSFSIRRRYVEKQQQKRIDLFMFICYFSTNKNDTLFSITSLDSPSNSTSIRCLTLLRSMECSSRLEILPFLAPVMVEKTTPPPTKVTGKFQKKYLYIRAHKLIMHSVPTLSKLRSGTSCQIKLCEVVRHTNFVKSFGTHFP